MNTTFDDQVLDDHMLLDLVDDQDGELGDLPRLPSWPRPEPWEMPDADDHQAVAMPEWCDFG